MNIFVVGGAGFIGSAFVRHLYKSEQYKILNFDLLTYAANPQALSGVKAGNRYSFVKGDITDYEAILAELEKFEPDVVINFAAETHVDQSILKPLKFVETNVLGTACLLNACSTYLGARPKASHVDFRYIQVSTDEVFGDLGVEEKPFSEHSHIKPSSPYSASKAGADMMVRAWIRTYGFPAIITNCSNNFGPFQNREKFIPTVISSLINKAKIPIYGDGTQIRDWLYVEDHVRALELIMLRSQLGETFNIGGDTELTNIEVVKKIIEAFSQSTSPVSNGEDVRKDLTNLIHYVEDRPGHDRRYAIDCSKLKNELGWHPCNNFEHNLRETVRWYLEANSDSHLLEKK